MKKYLATLFVSILLLGCNTNLIQPEVVKQFVKTPQIKAVELKSFSVEEQKVVFDVSVYNPNVFALPISQINGDFRLNNLTVGGLSASSDKTLAAQETQVVTLPMQLNSKAFIDAAKLAFTTRQADYKLNGGLKTSAGSLPFSKEGSVSASDLMSALLP